VIAYEVFSTLKGGPGWQGSALLFGFPMAMVNNSVVILSPMSKCRLLHRTLFALLSCVTLSMDAQQVGHVVAWGHIAIPNLRPGTHYKGIAAGFRHCLAVTEDGKVVAWGQNAQGESTVPANLTGVIAVAAGMERGVALTENGAVAFLPGGMVSDLTNVSAIASGAYHSLAVRRTAQSPPLDTTITAKMPLLRRPFLRD